MQRNIQAKKKEMRLKLDVAYQAKAKVTAHGFMKCNNFQAYFLSIVPVGKWGKNRDFFFFFRRLDL